MKIKIAQKSIRTTTPQVAIQTKPNKGSKPDFFHHPITLKVCFLQKPDLFDLTDNSPRSLTLITSWEHCQNPSANHFIYVFALPPCAQTDRPLLGHLSEPKNY